MLTRRSSSYYAGLCAFVLCIGAAPRVHADKRIHLMRVMPGGSLDTSFGADGHVTDNLSGTSDDTCMDMVVSGNKLIIAGINDVGGNLRFMIGRLELDGTPDETFSTDGYSTATWSAYDHERAVAVAEFGGKPIAAGYGYGAQRQTALVARWTSTGALDTSFSGDGLAAIDHEGWDTSVEGMTVQPDGKIIVVGAATNQADEDDKRFFMARLTAAGVLDTTFDTDGKKLFKFSGATSATARDVVVFAGEGLLPWIGVVGEAWLTGGGSRFAVAYLKQDGSFEYTFDDDGRKLIDFGGVGSQGLALDFDSEYRMTLAGITYPAGGGTNFAVARVTSDGALDTAFSDDGLATINVSNVGGLADEYVRDVYIGVGGKVTIVGSALSSVENRAAIVRLNSDGTPHTAFSGDGKRIFDDPLGFVNNAAVSASAVSNDRIVTCGVVAD